MLCFSLIPWMLPWRHTCFIVSAHMTCPRGLAAFSPPAWQLLHFLPRLQAPVRSGQDSLGADSGRWEPWCQLSLKPTLLLGSPGPGAVWLSEKGCGGQQAGGLN